MKLFLPPSSSRAREVRREVVELLFVRAKRGERRPFGVVGVVLKQVYSELEENVLSDLTLLRREV